MMFISIHFGWKNAEILEKNSKNVQISKFISKQIQKKKNFKFIS